MFSIGDIVVHKTTGNLGEICGYGHWIVNNSYLPTLKVLLLDRKERKQQVQSLVEDLYREWMVCQTKLDPALSLQNQSQYQDVA
jgi:hypothetical protein